MAALDDYGPFDGQSKNEDFWRDFFRHLTGSGVIDGVGDEFVVSERGAGANMSVDVGTGECFIRGHWGEATSTKNVPISAADATNPRIDRIVLRADFTANTVSVEVLEGTPAASPSAPALTQSSSRWEISLAQVSVPATDTSIGSAQITDEREIFTYGPGDSGTSFQGVELSNSVGQTLTTATYTAITWDVEGVDTDGAHDGVNPTRITIPASWNGKKVEFVAQLQYGNSATGQRYIEIRKNGAVTTYAMATEKGDGTHTLYTSALIPSVTTGDYYEVLGYQGSGGNLDVNGNSSSGHSSFFYAKVLGD